MKASEKRLIMILGVLVAVCTGALLSRQLLRLQHGIDRREQALELRQMEASALLAEAGLWQQRLEWLRASQPPMTSESVASQELLEDLLASAAAQGLVVQKKKLHELVRTEFQNEVAVTLTVRGGLPALFRWIHQLLSPEAFCLVTELKVTPDAADPASVVALISFSRLHAPVVAGAQAPSR
ncbi:hypothetical protein [Prosthecobacter fluviatilis]|uniref:Uncharacterized protein n=1 Tax=Prosthecobacter fluviatilis TaxID=445931 RepID=A0ABW0KX23_9BACT